MENCRNFAVNGQLCLGHCPRDKCNIPGCNRWAAAAAAAGHQGGECLCVVHRAMAMDQGGDFQEPE